MFVLTNGGLDFHVLLINCYLYLLQKSMLHYNIPVSVFHLLLMKIIHSCRSCYILQYLLENGLMRLRRYYFFQVCNEYLPFRHLCPNLSFSVKNFEKNIFFLRFLWKALFKLILIWRIQNLDSFFKIFSSSFSFLPRLVKNVLKNGSKVFFFGGGGDFPENCHIT